MEEIAKEEWFHKIFHDLNFSFRLRIIYSRNFRKNIGFKVDFKEKGGLRFAFFFEMIYIARQKILRRGAVSSSRAL